MKWMIGIASFLLIGGGHFSEACAFPTKPIKAIIGYEAGSSSDIAGRTFLQHVEKELGQTILVINKPGAASALALRELLASKPDGYTLALSCSFKEWEQLSSTLICSRVVYAISKFRLLQNRRTILPLAGGKARRLRERSVTPQSQASRERIESAIRQILVEVERIELAKVLRCDVHLLVQESAHAGIPLAHRVPLHNLLSVGCV